MLFSGGELKLVHAFEVNGYYIAVDVNSGSVHSLDRITYEILKAFPDDFSKDKAIQRFKDTFGLDDVMEACEEIERLKAEGMLYSPELDDTSLLRQLENGNGLKALCLHVAHDCNLRCKYCFASEGNYCSERRLMPEEVAFRALDYLVSHSGNRRNIEVDFFGGEPLLNFDVVKSVVAYGREIEKRGEKKFHFTITTNGTLLDGERIDFINENMDNVVISLDGRKSIHDSMRYHRNGRGSYDRIVGYAKQLVNGRGDKSYYIRGTFTNENLDFSEDVFHIAGLGFDEISIEPVVGSGQPFHITEEHIPAILDEYERLAKRCIEYIKSGKKLNFYHFNVNLYGGPCIQRRIVACGAGFEYLAVSPEGHFFPCHQFVGQPQFIMGDVFRGIDDPGRLSDRFKRCNILTKEQCRVCWAKYFCSGGCHANAYFTNGSIDIPNELACLMQRKRIECALMMEVALSSESA